MTKKEALIVLETMATNLTGALAGQKNPAVEDFFKRRIEAINIAETAIEAAPDITEHMNAFEQAYKNGYEAGLKAAKATGEWTEEHDDGADIFFQRRFVCSACGEYSLYGKSKFCPECGAKMEVEE